MNNFIEDFYYGNIEPIECTTELTAKVKKSLSELVSKEEQLKEKNQMEWIQRMNNIRNRATDIVNTELIYNA